MNNNIVSAAHGITHDDNTWIIHRSQTCIEVHLQIKDAFVPRYTIGLLAKMRK